jgi:hypothetical protein
VVLGVTSAREVMRRRRRRGAEVLGHGRIR